MAVQEIRIQRQGGDIGGLLAVPSGSGPFPGVIVIPTVRAFDDFAHYAVETALARKQSFFGLIAGGD